MNMTFIFEFAQDRGGQHPPRANRENDVHQILPMRFDQLPINGVFEQAIDMPIGDGRIRPIEDQVFPIANAGHELNA